MSIKTKLIVSVTILIEFDKMRELLPFSIESISNSNTANHVHIYVIILISLLLLVFSNLIVWGIPDINSNGDDKNNMYSIKLI